MSLDHQVVHSGKDSDQVCPGYAPTEGDNDPEVAEAHVPLVAGGDEGTGDVMVEGHSNNGKGCVRRHLSVGGTHSIVPSVHVRQKSNTVPVDLPRRVEVETAPASYQGWSSFLDD